jgi:hypothetical protein
MWLLSAALLLLSAPFLLLGRLLLLLWRALGAVALRVKRSRPASSQVPLQGQLLQPWQGSGLDVGPSGNRYQPVPLAELEARAEAMQQFEQEQRDREYLRSLQSFPE